MEKRTCWAEFWKCKTSSTGGTLFLGQIPLLKYLFSSTQKEHITNELVFVLVPHIVRSQELNDLNRRAFDVGTGSGIDLRMGGRQMPASNVTPAAATPAPQQQPAGGAPATPARQPAATVPQQQVPDSNRRSSKMQRRRERLRSSKR